MTVWEKVETELNALKARREALAAFVNVNGGEFDQLSVVHRSLLFRQLTCMTDYEFVLTVRLELLGAEARAKSMKSPTGM